MKYFIATCLIVLCLQSKGQGLLDTISNTYLLDTNQLHTLLQIKNYRALINMPSQMGDKEEFGHSISYFKIINPSASNEPGLLNMSYGENSSARTVIIEDLLEGYYPLIARDQDENDVVTGVEKTANVHGCFFILKNRRFIYLFMLKQPTMDFVRVLIEMDNLTTSQMEALARDFIQNTSFY